MVLRVEFLDIIDMGSNPACDIFFFVPTCCHSPEMRQQRHKCTSIEDKCVAK